MYRKSRRVNHFELISCAVFTLSMGPPPKRLHPKQVKNDFQADFPPARHLPNSSHSWERRASTDIWYQSSTCFCKRRWHLPVSSAAKRSQYKTVFSKILECFAQMLSNVILYTVIKCYKWCFSYNFHFQPFYFGVCFSKIVEKWLAPRGDWATPTKPLMINSQRNPLGIWTNQNIQ